MKAVAMAALIVATMLAGCFGGSSGEDTIGPSNAVGTEAGFSDTHVFPGEYDLSGPYSRVLEPGDLAILPPETAWVENADDGVRLPLMVHRPDTREPVPVILMSAYDSFLDQTRQSLGDATYVTSNYFPLVANYVPHGYATAFLGLRGMGASEGCWDFGGTGHRGDMEAAISWLAEQEWSTGAVGVIGLSMGGLSTWAAAATGHPALETIVPVAGIPDVFEFAFHNGTTNSWVLAQFNSYAVVDAGSPRPERLNCESDRDALTAVAEGTVAASRDSPLHEYWTERDQRPLVEQHYNGSIFSVQGLRDITVRPGITYPWIHQLEEKGVVVKHLLGQWFHTMPDQTSGPGLRWDWAEILLHWLDHELKGDETVDLGPRVQVQDSMFLWRSENDWPPADAQNTTFYLRADGTLGFDPSADEGLFAAAPSAGARPLAAEDPLVDEVAATPPIPCEACAHFVSAPMEAEVRFAGTPSLPLTLVPTAPRGEVTATMYVVAPTGDATRVGHGMMDLRYADGTDEPAAVEPGQRLLTHMQLEPVDIVVPKDGRLVLVVSHLGTYAVTAPDPLGGPVAVVAGGEASRLEVRTFERGPDDFFDPPISGDDAPTPIDGPTHFEFGPTLGCSDIGAGLPSTCVSFVQGPGAEPVDGVWISLNDSYWGHRFTSTVGNGIGDSDCYMIADDAETVIDHRNNELGPCAGTVPNDAAFLFLYSPVVTATAMTLTFDQEGGT